MKRRVPRNVNGRVPANSSIFNEMYPKGTPAREAVEAKLESSTGQDFMTVCIRSEVEARAAQAAEAAEKQARKDAKAAVKAQ